MRKKKNLVNVHCRVEPLTSEKLKSWSDELGMTVGEMIDHIVKWYEDYSNNQDAELEKEVIQDQLLKLSEKINRIEQKIGIE